MSKPLPLDKPTRRGIDELFRDLRNFGGYSSESPLYAEYGKLKEELEKLGEELLSCPSYRTLRKKKDNAYQKWRIATTQLEIKLGEVRRDYLAKGLTPAVQNEINKLVELANKK